MPEALSSIIRKEVKDGLRDRRALITLLAMPVFFLALMVGMVFFMLSMQAKSESFRLPVQGAEYAGPLIDWLQEEGVEIVTVEGDPVELVRNRQQEFVLVIPEDFPEKFSQYDDASIQLVLDRSRSNIQGRASRVRYLVQQWSGRLGSLRLIARGVAPPVANPVQLRDLDVADQQKTASRLLAVIPIMLVMTIFTASIGLSVDMMAGEREKHSLEPLLLNPVSRETVLAGKWLAAILCTLVVLIITAVAVYYIVPQLPLERLGLQYHISALRLLQTILVAVPLIGLATMVQLLVSILAKSFKEAQSYISLLVMVPMVTAYYVLFTDATASWQLWVPILGPLTLMEAILNGEAPGPWAWSVATGVSLLLALLTGAILVRQLKREKIIYG